MGVWRGVNWGWRLLIDAHFTVIFSHQFIFHLEKNCLNNNLPSPYLAMRELASLDFDKALKKINTFDSTREIEESFSQLVDFAQSKEELLLFFDAWLSRPQVYSLNKTMEILQPLVKKYFALLAPGKTEAHFKEGEALLIKFPPNHPISLFIALSLVDTFPELAMKNRESIKPHCNQLTPCEQDDKVLGQFSFSTCFQITLIAELFPSNEKLVYCLARKSPSKEEVQALMSVVGKEVPPWILTAFMGRFTIYELLRMAEKMPSTQETYQFYYSAISRTAISAEEFFFALQKFLEKGSILDAILNRSLYQAFKKEVISLLCSFLVEKYLSVEVYALLEKHFPNDLSLGESYLKIALACPSARLPLLEKIRKGPPLETWSLGDKMKLEIMVGQIEEARKTFCSINNTDLKCSVLSNLKYFIEKKEWHHFDVFFKEFHAFYKKPPQVCFGNPLDETKYFPKFLNLLKQVASKDLKRAVHLAKSHWQGMLLLRLLIEIGVEQENPNADLTNLIEDVRSLATQKHKWYETRDLVLFFQLLKREGTDSANFKTITEVIENSDFICMKDDFLIQLCDLAHSKPEILKTFELASKLKNGIDDNTFCKILYPLIRKYFVLATEADCNEALSLLDRFFPYEDLYFVMSLALVDTFPEFIKNHARAKEFPFSTFLKFYDTQPKASLLLEILNPKDNSNANGHRYLLMKATNIGIHAITTCAPVLKKLNGSDLLLWVTSLPDGPKTYDFYRDLFKEKLKTAAEFETGMQNLLKRTPSNDLKQTALEIVEGAPLEYLTPTVVALLMSTFPGDPTLEKTYLKMAIEQEKDLSQAITLAQAHYTPEQQIHVYIKRAQQHKTLGQEYRFLLAEARSLAFTHFSEEKPGKLITVLKQLLDVEKI